MAKADAFEQFLEDIYPYFYNRRVSYFDAGAFVGDSFQKVMGSKLGVHEAILVEANPESAEIAKLTARAYLGQANKALKTLQVYNKALGAEKGTAKIIPARDMTRVVDNGSQSISDADITIDRVTLDSILSDLVIPHISLLKIDVEGAEMDVLSGAKELLSNSAVDVIYIEAGMNKDTNQQTYYRDIEDRLLEDGYRIFGIYEQTNEWTEDSPILRRVNQAYMSAPFAANNPMRLSKELVSLKEQHALQKTEHALQKAEIERLSVALHEKSAAAMSLSKDISDLMQLTGRLESQYSRVVGSTSWRTTRLLRRVASLLLGREYDGTHDGNANLAAGKSRRDELEQRLRSSIDDLRKAVSEMESRNPIKRS